MKGTCKQTKRYWEHAIMKITITLTATIFSTLFLFYFLHSSTHLCASSMHTYDTPSLATQYDADTHHATKKQRVSSALRSRNSLSLNANHNALLLSTCQRKQEDPETTLSALDANADVNTQTHNGHTPIYYAAQQGHTNIIQLLIEHEAHLNQQTRDTKETALICAIRTRHPACAKLLIEHGANVNTCKDGRLCSPLHVAVDVNDLETARLLIEHQADVSKRDCDNHSPWYYACTKGLEPDYPMLFLSSRSPILGHDVQQPSNPTWCPEMMQLLYFANPTTNNLSTNSDITDLPPEKQEYITELAATKKLALTLLHPTESPLISCVPPTPLIALITEYATDPALVPAPTLPATTLTSSPT